MYLHLLIGFVYVINCQNCEIGIITKVAKRNPITRFQAGLLNRRFRSIQANRDTEEGTICKPKIFHHSMPALANGIRIQIPLENTLVVILLIKES